MYDALGQMIDALDIEVAAIKKRGGGTTLDLRNGRFVEKAGTAWLYRFIVAADVTLRDDSPVKVKIAGASIAGTLVSFRENVLIVALDAGQGPAITSARLVTDDSFLIERLKVRLEEVRDGTASINGAAADRALGLAPLTVRDVSRTAPIIIQVTGDGTLNDEQVLALRQALGSDTTFVWGPPGTGKTTTLARIVEAHYRTGRSVLLVSNTNIAVDTALEQVARRLRDDAGFQKGRVIRKGVVVKPELREEFGKWVIPEEIAKRHGEDLHEEKDQLQRELPPLEARESEIGPLVEAHERHAEAAANLRALEREASEATRDAARLEDEAMQRASEAVRFRADADHAESMSTLRRLVTRVDPARLRLEAEAAEQEAHAKGEAARSSRQRATEREAEAARLRSEVDRLAERIEGQPPVHGVRAEMAVISAEIQRIRRRIKEIDATLAMLEQWILADARIVATTVYQTYLGADASRRFDVVVIDEASMLMPSLTWYAAGLARTSVTIAGDFRQLAPIVVSDDPLAAEWLKRDAFQVAGIPNAIEQGTKQPDLFQVAKTPQTIAQGVDPPELVSLTMQYRMVEPICDVINHRFYQGRLRTHPSVNERDDDFPFGTGELFYIDTAAESPWAAFREGSRSRYNLFHALLIRNIVKHLSEQGYLLPDGPSDRLGIVAPYGAQARLIQELLGELPEREAGLAATVHRFQGNEKDTMLIDMVDSTGVPPGRFLKAKDIEEDGARLLNVALSRARSRVILMGNFDYFKREIGNGGYILPEIIRHFKKNGTPLDVDQLLPLTNEEWLSDTDTISPLPYDFPEDASGLFNQSSFYPIFRRDIESATMEIIIFSPFMYEDGTRRWIHALRAAVERGVNVQIHTRPPGPLFQKELSKSLRRNGVTVSYRHKMHEKIAVIDGKILWHGSLNILSHRNTSESMMRILSTAFCQQLTGNLLDPSPNPPCRHCGGDATRKRRNKDGRIFFECLSPGCGKTFNPPRPAR